MQFNLRLKKFRSGNSRYARVGRLRARSLASAALLAMYAASAQNATWVNPVTGNWFDASKWTGGIVPDGINWDANFSASGAPYTVAISQSLDLRSLSLASSDATLAISNATFTITGGVNSVGGFFIGPNARLSIWGGELNPATTFNGGGTIQFERNVTNINISWNHAGVTQCDAAAGPASVNFNAPVSSAISIARHTVNFNHAMSGIVNQTAGVSSFHGAFTGTANLHGGTVALVTGPTFENGILKQGVWNIHSPAVRMTGAPITTLAADVRFNADGQITDLHSVTANSGTITLNGTNWPLGNSGILSNSGGLIRSGSGSTYVPGTRSIHNTGTITVSGGTMAIATSANFSPLNPTTLNGGNWIVANDGYLGFGSALGSGTITAIATNTSVTLDGSNAQMPSLNFLNTNFGTITVRGGKNFVAGPSVLNAGTIVVGAGSTWFPFTTLNFSGGKMLLSSDNTSPGVLRMFGQVATPALPLGPFTAAEILSTGNGSLAGTIDMMNKSGVFNVANVPAFAIDLDVSASLTNGNLSKSGSGTMRIRGVNSYQGPTFINSGTLLMGAAATLPAATALTFSTAAGSRHLDLAGYNQTVESLAGNGTVLLGGATFTVGGVASTNFGGRIDGNGSFRKTGAGTLISSGTLAHNGPLIVNDGYMKLLSPTQNSFTGAINLSGGTLYAETDLSLGDPLFQPNPINISGGTFVFGDATARTLTISNNSTIAALGNATLSGSLNGGGTLNISHESYPFSKLFVNGAASFAGSVNIKDSTLHLAGGLSGMPNVPTFRAGTGGTLQLDRSTSGAGPLPSSGGPMPSGGMQDVRLNGGTLQVVGKDGASITENFGTLFLEDGASTIHTLPGTPGTLTLNFASFGPRAGGATVNWIASDPGVTDRIFFDAGVPDGFIGSFFTINGTDFAKYNPTDGVRPFAPGDYNTGFVRDTHVLVDESTNVPNTSSNPPDPFNIRTLNLTASSALTVTIPATTTLELTEGGLIKSGSATANISGGTLTWDGDELNISVSGGTLNISSTITRTGPGNHILTKRGDGTLNLSGSNASSYSGVTMIAGAMHLNKPAGTNAIPGDLEISGGRVTSFAGEQIINSAKVTLNAGVLDLNDQTETIEQLINNNGTVLFNGGTLITKLTELNGGTTTIASTLNATVALSITGGKNTVSSSGVVSVEGLSLSGVASASIELASGALNSGRIVLAGDVTAAPPSGTLRILSSGAGAVPGRLDLNNAQRTFTISSGQSREDLQITAQIIGGGTLGAMIKSGPGTMQLTATNTYSGGTRINGGTLEGIGTAAFGSGSIVFGAGTTSEGVLGLRSDLAVATFGNAISAGSVARDIFVDIDRVTTGVANRFVLGTASLGASLSLYGAGTLQLGASTLNATAVVNAYDNTISINGPIGGGSNGIIVGGPPASPGDILPGQDKGGSSGSVGTLSMDGTTANTYTGLTTVNDGTLALNHTPGQFAIVGPLTVTGGTVLCLQDDQFATTVDVTMNTPGGTFDINGTTQTIHDLTLAAGTVQSAGGTLNVTGTVSTPPPTGSLPEGSGTLSPTIVAIDGGMNFTSVLPAILLVNVTDQLSINGAVVSSAGLTIDGAGTLTLLSNSTISGAITLNGGALNIGATTIGSASMILNGGVLYVSGSVPNLITLGTAGGNVHVPLGQTATLSQPIVGTGMNKLGAGTAILTATNSFTGTINIAAGTVQVNSDANLGNVSNIVDISAGALHYGATISSPRALLMNGGAISVAANQVVTLNGTGMLGGAGSLIKSGPGTLIVNRPRTYLGATQVSGGTLSFSSQPPELLSGGTLNSGVWIVDQNSTLTLAGPAITTNKASVTLQGVNSSFNNLTSFSRNEGSFLIEAGRLFTTASSFTNTGTISIGAASGLKINSTLANTGTIDVSGAMVIDYSTISPANGVRSQVISGYAQGTWRGLGINSSTAATDDTTGVAVADTTESGLAFSQISTDASSVIVLLTTLGDANLDSAVNSLDFNRLTANYGRTSFLWSEGDFNYDGRITTLDFNHLAGNFGASLGIMSASVPDIGRANALESSSGPIGNTSALGSVVPEPGCSALVAVCLGLMHRGKKFAHQ